MLNNERIRLMTRLAAYEQGQGKEDMSVTRYYQGDYVALQMIKTFAFSTIAFGILILLSVLYQMDTWMETLYQGQYLEFGLGILVKYVIFEIVYLAMALVRYTYQYKHSYKNQKLYSSRLKKVEKLYEREEDLLPQDDWEEAE